MEPIRQKGCLAPREDWHRRGVRVWTGIRVPVRTQTGGEEEREELLL